MNLVFDDVFLHRLLRGKISKSVRPDLAFSGKCINFKKAKMPNWSKAQMLHFKGSLKALLTNIRLGQRSLECTSSLAYFSLTLVTKKKNVSSHFQLLGMQNQLFFLTQSVSEFFRH
jgi:hypothetical protein